MRVERSADKISSKDEIYKYNRNLVKLTNDNIVRTKALSRVLLKYKIIYDPWENFLFLQESSIRQNFSRRCPDIWTFN